MGCKAATTSPPPPATRNLVLITIDTLRADHVGGYGYTRARTPTLDSLAAGGTLFERAYSAAPITLTSHATLMSGRYPPGHGARDNGMHVSAGVPTLATELHAHGFRTGAFVAAFPLDHQFGLNRGFDVYSDRLPRGPDGRLANERPASQVVDEAIAWLNHSHQSSVVSHQSSVGSRHVASGPGTRNRTQAPRPDQAPSTTHQAPFFLWVHLFEPHAPYGDATPQDVRRSSGTTMRSRWRMARWVAWSALWRRCALETLVVVAGDHGEAFGEHGEYAHSIFVYDTTLHVPLIMNGPAIRGGARVSDPVTLADVAPTAMRLLGLTHARGGRDRSGGGAWRRGHPASASSMPSRSRRWSNSAGRRCDRSDRVRGSSSPRRSRSCSTSIATPARTDNVAASQPSTVPSGFASRASRYADAGLPGTTRAGSAGRRTAACARLQQRLAAGRQRQASGSEGSARAGRAHRAGHLRRTVGRRAGVGARGHRARRSAQRSGASPTRLRAAPGRATARARSRSFTRPSAPVCRPPTCISDSRRALGSATISPAPSARWPKHDASSRTTRRWPPTSASCWPRSADWAGAIACALVRAAPPTRICTRRGSISPWPTRSPATPCEAAATARDLLTRLPPGAPQRTEVERLLRAVQ